MACHICGNNAIGLCRQCFKFYCREHGDGFCSSCQQQVWEIERFTGVIARDIEGATTAASPSMTEGSGSVLVSLIAPTVLTGGPAEALAALATTLIAWRTRNPLLAMLVGVSVVLIARIAGLK